MGIAVETLPATFTTKMARSMGAQSRDLHRWRAEGVVVELSRGVFRRADAPEPSFPDLLAVGVRAPRAIVCCVSAAVVHGLSDEMEPAVQIAVSSAHNMVRIRYPPTMAFRFDAETFELGLSRVEAAPEEFVRIYDPARTVVDLIRLRHRLGEPAAYTALNRFLDLPDGRRAQLMKYAEALGAAGPVGRALDIAAAR